MDAGWSPAHWSQDRWRALERNTARASLAAPQASGKWARVARSARHILRTYSTSFFIVTRFLPTAKRQQVEVIYAAVRYPDEIVDTVPIGPDLRFELLDKWWSDYERALRCESLEESLANRLNCFAAAFADVVRRNGIPTDYYRAFLDAMRLDVKPRLYTDLDDLIESYIYGSAIVVGYFLAYVYGASAPAEFDRAITASRDLGIALQLTNFLRDVREDYRRGRVYLPLDYLREEGISRVDPDDESTYPALNRVLQRLSHVAENHYSGAERHLDAFAPDCRIAIQSCIDVYRQLNLRIGRSPKGILHRETVPTVDKFRVLPPSKYWRLPLAYVGAI
jgi:phytoene synthase